jgi:hypothetical protein
MPRIISQTMSAFTKNNALLCDGVLLPKFLFRFDVVKKSKNVSPFAGFNPVAALNDCAFETSISPSSVPKKKTLIIDQDSLANFPDYGERIALLKRLKIAGFEIFLRSVPTAQNPSHFHKLDDALSNITQLHNLSKFKSPQDYEELLKQAVARDDVLLITKEKYHVDDIVQALEQNQYHSPNATGTNFKCELRSLFKEEVGLNEIFFPASPDKKLNLQMASFYLDRLPQEQSKKLFAEFLKQVENPIVPLQILILPPCKEMFLQHLASKNKKISDFFDSFYKEEEFNFFVRSVLNIFPEASDEIFSFLLKKLNKDNGKVSQDSNLGEVIGLFEYFPQKRKKLIEVFGGQFLKHDQKVGESIEDVCIGFYEGRIDEFEKYVNSLLKKSSNKTLSARETFLHVSDLQPLILVGLSDNDLSKKLLDDFFSRIPVLLNSQKYQQIGVLAQARIIPSLQRMPRSLVLPLLKSFKMKDELYYLDPKMLVRDVNQKMVNLASNRKFPSEIANAGIALSKKIKASAFNNISAFNEERFLKDSLTNFEFDSSFLEKAKLEFAFAVSATRPTYLDLGDIAGDFDVNKMIKENLGHFSNVAVIRFPYAKNLKDCEAILKNFQIDGVLRSSIKHLIFPKSLEANKDEIKKLCFGTSVEFLNYDYEGILSYLESLKKSREEDFSPFISRAEESKAVVRSKKIQIGFAKINSNLGVDSEISDSVFEMASAGEVLNGDSEFLMVRNAIIERDIVKNLLQKEYLPASFKKVETIKSLSPAELESFKVGSLEKIYCQFVLPLKANEKFRLLSVDSAEDLIGIVGNVEGLTIERGDDDFFYATSTTDRNLTYVLKAQNPKLREQSYQSLSANDPIRKIIDEYRDSTKGFLQIAEKEKEQVDYDPKNHQASMEKMFQARAGVCRHRVAAVEYKLKMSGISSDRFRSVMVNGNHEILEVKGNDGLWIQVDLGGGNSILNSSDKPYSFKPITKAEHAKKADEDLKHSAIIPKDWAFMEEARKVFLSSLKLEQVANVADLKAKTISNPKNKILVVAPNTVDHSNFLMSQAVAQGRDIYLIDAWNKIDLHHKNLRIANDSDKASLTDEGLLSDFFKRAKAAPATRPILLINWDKFTAAQKIKLNTILDLERRVNGELIPANVQIIGVSSKLSKDSSFTSRHEVSVESRVNFLEAEKEKSQKEEKEKSDAKEAVKAPLNPAAAEAPRNLKEVIDLEGFQNWRRKLFGKIVLEGDKMNWQSSQFVEALKKGKNDFEFTNLSSKAKTDFEAELATAKALGKFVYHGYEIKCPPNLKISFAKNQFNFEKFQDKAKILVTKNVTINQAPNDCEIINQNLFEALLNDKEIKDGKHFEKLGLIEKAKAAKVLKLFISSDLNSGQWYCLFNEAKKHDVKLELHLAPNVELPNRFYGFSAEQQIAKEAKSKEQDQKQMAASFAKVLVTNDAAKSALELVKEVNPFAVIDVEDLTYQDLVERIDFKTTKDGYKDFKKTKSQFLEALESGKKIILKGEFASDLLQMLEPLISGKKPFEAAAKNLVLIVEDKECREGNVYKPLAFLPKDACKVKTHQKIEPLKTAVHFEKEDLSNDLKDSEKKSQQFIQTRKKVFVDALKGSQMLRLMGHSGVGKSSLLREFETHDKATTTVYRELDAFEKWANDKSEKTKILFIDEANIDDMHFTMFAPLKKGGNGRVLYKGKFYDLSPNHKVVFAGNPKEYGGGRQFQKLFEDGTIPAIELRDFPACYIYEKTLKEVIYQKLSKEIRDKFAEIEFQKICIPLIEQYQKLNSAKKSQQDANQETVRELQEKVLVKIAKQFELSQSAKMVVIGTVSFSGARETQTKNFVSVEATKVPEKALKDFLNISFQQRIGKFPNEAIGLNGLIMQGKPGCGKSELIAAIFENIELKEKKFIFKSALEEASKEQQRQAAAAPQKQGFYKIEAAMPLEQKKAIIIKAFEDGDIIWIDELNSCVDEGLEKILNAALTGEHPEGKKDKVVVSGFRMVASINSAALEGRSLISTALQHRCIMVRAKDLNEYSQDDLEEIVRHNLKDVPIVVDSTHCRLLAHTFKEMLMSKGSEEINLRLLKERVNDFYSAQNEKVKKDAASASANPATKMTPMASSGMVEAGDRSRS